MTKLYDMCLRGGASKTLVYSSILLELDAKPDVAFSVLSGASGGALLGSLMACGYSHQKAKEILTSVGCDDLMLQQKEIEQASNIFKKGVALVKFWRGRTKLYYALKTALKTYISWDKMTRCETFYSCVVWHDDIAKLFGSDKKFSFIDTIKMLREKDHPGKVAKSVPPHYLSNKGIFRWDFDKKELVKVSDTVIPMWLAVFSSFWNQVFPDFNINYYIDGEPVTSHPFDGGAVNNEAHLPMPNENYISVQCVEPPNPGKMQGVSDWVYHQRPPKNVTVLHPFEQGKSFFAFYDQSIALEFDNAKPTNLFL